MNGWSNLDETDTLAPTDDVSDFEGQRSRSQPAVEVAKASMSTLG